MCGGLEKEIKVTNSNLEDKIVNLIHSVCLTVCQLSVLFSFYHQLKVEEHLLTKVQRIKALRLFILRSLRIFIIYLKDKNALLFNHYTF